MKKWGERLKHPSLLSSLRKVGKGRGRILKPILVQEVLSLPEMDLSQYPCRAFVQSQAKTSERSGWGPQSFLVALTGGL